MLLANLTTVGEVGVTYNPSLRQLLVLLPPYVAGFGSLSPMNNPTGFSLGAFSLMNGDPPPCTVGFLPPSQWRSPADETVIDTPDNLYCKLPQDSPIAVRGVRNNPCMGHPGKRAPTVEICDSDQPYEPLAMRQHVLGPVPVRPQPGHPGRPSRIAGPYASATTPTRRSTALPLPPRLQLMRAAGRRTRLVAATGRCSRAALQHSRIRSPAASGGRAAANYDPRTGTIRRRRTATSTSRPT